MVISVSEKKDVHLLFNLDDERQRAALELFLEQSTPRRRTDFIVDAILAYNNNLEIARLVAAEIKAAGPSKKTAISSMQSAANSGKTGRPRGRPPKQKPAPDTIQPAPEPGLSSASRVEATSPQLPRTADEDNQSLLRAIQESFG